MPTDNPALPVPQAPAQPRRTVKQILLSYFYWTYSRGSFHYDVMVTLILLFIFLTPQIPGWSYGDKPSPIGGPLHPIQVIGNDGHGVIVTVQASDVSLDLHTAAPYAVIKKALRKAIEPVTGDDVFVVHWETATDDQGHPVWKVWAHR
ncbi:MAG TPA: hypothetical protein VN776_02500 [Terracidiphilus sp.]|nr:hypothetical protein [Terracidiphilus sp.]